MKEVASSFFFPSLQVTSYNPYTVIYLFTSSGARGETLSHFLDPVQYFDPEITCTHFSLVSLSLLPCRKARKFLSSWCFFPLTIRRKKLSIPVVSFVFLQGCSSVAFLRIATGTTGRSSCCSRCRWLRSRGRRSRSAWRRRSAQSRPKGWKTMVNITIIIYWQVKYSGLIIVHYSSNYAEVNKLITETNDVLNYR